MAMVPRVLLTACALVRLTQQHLLPTSIVLSRNTLNFIYCVSSPACHVRPSQVQHAAVAMI